MIHTLIYWLGASLLGLPVTLGIVALILWLSHRVLKWCSEFWIACLVLCRYRKPDVATVRQVAVQAIEEAEKRERLLTEPYWWVYLLGVLPVSPKVNCKPSVKRWIAWACVSRESQVWQQKGGE